MNKNLLLVLSFFALSFAAPSQQMMSISPKKPIVCYLEPKDKRTSFGPPQAFLKAKNNPSARTNAAVFIVEYIGFDAQAKAAFQQAVDIWSSLIQSPVKIRIKAYWHPLKTGVLGQAIWGSVLANFPNAQKLNTFYPVALAEKIAGKDLNHPDSTDIRAEFSSVAAWYYGTTGTPPAQTTDLVSVVLHEIGHGLGFTDSYDVTNGQGAVGLQGSAIPMVYDLSIENTTNQNLFQSYATPSAALNTQLTSNNIFYNSPLAAAQNGQRPRVYAPATWSGGSSIAHLNEATYTSGNSNSLMTPFIGFTEVMHDPGPIVLNMFSDMGWLNTRINHAPTNTESLGTPYMVIAKVASDNGYDPSNVKLFYTKQSGGTETPLAGTPTGNADEFSFSIPASASSDSIFYYISATDNISRVFTNPGKFVKSQNPEKQGRFAVGLGPDTKAPVITHTPKAFILASSTSLKLDATVADNIGIQEVLVDYWINNNLQPSVAMAQDGTISNFTSSLIPTYSSNYTATINFTAGLITDGDKITYRIRSKDSSIAQNIGFSPSPTTSHSINVVGLAATQDLYQNNFDDLVSTDFFGDPQFSIVKPSNFTNGAIHSIHPYVEGKTSPADSLVYIYELRIPIRVKAQDATIRFDEIVLVEPGEPNSIFGTAAFFDYVVVEGSKDGGQHWTPVTNGYDSRDNTDWLARYNTSIVNDISNGVGDPALYRPRTMNLLNKFKAGDEVVIRFRLFSDHGAAGWGWAIDNLKIQIDETPPVVLHDHKDFTIGVTSPIILSVNATDPSGLSELTIETKVNNQPIQFSNFPVGPSITNYVDTLKINALSIGDDVQYRIRAKDTKGNEGFLPPSGFFHVPIISMDAPVAQYVSDFNSSNTDFVGNFFAISTPAGFSDGAMSTSHPYPIGFGLTASTSNYTYTLKKPITVNASNPTILFNEIAIVEYTVNADYVIVEGSKDNGTTWEALLDKYSGSAFPDWKNSFDSKQNGIPSLYKLRFFDITKSGKFKAGDNILIRFRLNANSSINAWGWAIDNLSIQGPITGLEKPFIENSFSVYPNPTSGSIVMVKFNTVDDSPVQLQVLSSQGNIQQSTMVQPVSKTVEQEFFVGDWSNGLYIIKAEVAGSIITKKFIKVH
jgi:hypothetical protein